jgi:flagellar hook-associated protein 1 FlgK
MSLTNALSVALSGLQTSTAAAQVISNNVANAQTNGYTNETIDLTEIVNSSGFGGVEISGYSNASDSVLSATLNSATSNASYLSTQNSYMTQVQSILDSTGNPPALSNDLSNFQSAWTEYAASPSDVTLEKSVISTGQALANEISNISTQTAALQTYAQTNLATSVKTLNTDLQQVQSLNSQISQALANNQPVGELEDQRAQAINNVAQYTNVTVLQRSDGQVALYTSSGTALIDGQAIPFAVSDNGNSVVNAAGNDVSSQLSGGTLQAQTDFLSPTATTANGVGVITKLQSQLENFANLFVAQTPNNTGGSFADAYNTAATGTGEQSQDFFTATIDSSTGLPDLSTFAVNANLVNGTAAVKVASATAVSNTFAATNLAIQPTVTGTSPNYTDTYATGTSFTAAGLSAQNQTYSGIANAILSGFQQAANTIQTQNATASTQQAYYQSSLSSETGVNTDSELVNLTNWENSYAASAHVISTIQSMMQTLEGMVG